MKKKLISITIILALVLLIIYYNKNNTTANNTSLSITKEQTPIDIEEYYVYGTHLNIKGTPPTNEYTNITLAIVSDKEIELPLITKEEENKTKFYISDKINTGMYLDNLTRTTHYLFIKAKDKDNNIKYYALNNTTTYPSITYYTLSKYNNKITINTDTKYNTLTLNVEENKDNNIYDITIDAGHGGKDSGAIGSSKLEKNVSLEVALSIKSSLEQLGYKVGITRDKDIDLEEYNVNNEIGRVVIPHINNSKYLFSIHLNSHANKNMHGVEILTPPNIDYTFASTLADSIVEKANTSYSNNMSFKMLNGVYTRIVTKEELARREDNPYNISVGAAYYYMLRESGGYITGGYVDGREKDVGINPYYNSNKGIESYIIELGYIINKNDIANIITNKDKYVEAITTTIDQQISKEYQ